MALTTAQVLAQIEKLLPPRYAASRAVLSLYAAMIAKVQQVAELDFIPSTTIAGAEGQWLTLLARGYGITRATGESDASVRTRLLTVEDALTVSAIEDAVDALLADLTAVPCELVEHWQAPLVLDTDDLDWALITDNSYFFDRHNAFTVIVPDFGDFPDDAIYAAIVAEVDRLRGAGVRAYILASGSP